MTSLQATADQVLAGTEAPQEAEPRILDHDYDGIREYDNPMPGWWSAIFWLTIVFSVAYAAYYHFARWGVTKEAAYTAGLAEYDSKRDRREAAEAASTSEESLARAATDPATVERGAALFAARCASCHESQGQGLIGPNLTDSFQIHGSTRMDVLKTIRGGVPGTAMLAWGEQMSGPDVVAASAFAITLRGTTVKGKEPQGQPVEAFARP